MEKSDQGGRDHAAVTAELAEQILEPALPIVDPHHHLRDRPGDRYLFDDLRRDLVSGHRIIATVAVESGDMYRNFGPETLRALGETEFFSGVAAMFDSGRYGANGGAIGGATSGANSGSNSAPINATDSATTSTPCVVCAGIVAYADLTLGAAVQPVLEAQRAAAGGRLRGIRCPVAWHDAPVLRTTRVGSAGRLADPAFRAGVALLASHQLSLDVWAYHTQLSDVAALARACPATRIVLNHTGGPLGIGPYAGARAEVFELWQAGLQVLAGFPNVYCKLGGLGMPIMGFGFDAPTHPARASSSVLAAAYAPYIEAAIAAFGVTRCMFESNFPPDHVSASYPVLWNTFKRIAAAYSDAEKTALFSGTASACYRLDDVLTARLGNLLATPPEPRRAAFDSPRQPTAGKPSRP